MKNQRGYNRIDNRKGYTLVEVMVVVAIIGILAGLAVGGLIAYQRHAAFKKNNEYAQTIFVAAQTALAQAKEAGQLEDLADALESGQEKQAGKITSGMITDAYEKTVPEDGRLFYMIFDESFDHRNPAADQTLHENIYDLISPYVYDDDVLDAVYCIEFDPVDGVVWGVCYNDRARAFAYTGASTEEHNNISDRKESVRKEIFLGYYGVDMLSGRAPGPQRRAVVEEFALVNDETLHLEWTLQEKYTSQALLMEYEFQLYEADGDRLACTFRVNQENKKDSMIKKKEDGTAEETGQKAYQIKCDVTVYDADGRKNKLEDIPFEAYVKETADQKLKFYLVLDAVDQKAAAILNEDYNGAVSQTNQTGETPSIADGRRYQETYSIKRLGLSFLYELETGDEKAEVPSTGLYLKMKASGKKYKSAKWKATTIQSAYFGAENISKEEGANEAAYDLLNPRHLFNIRFTEKGLENKTKIKADSKRLPDYHYVQKAELVWSSENVDGKGDGIAEKGLVYNGTVKVEKAEAYFPVIPVLHLSNSYSGAYVEEEQEKSHTISGIMIQGQAKAVPEEKNDPVGLFGVNEGTIQSLQMNGAKIEGLVSGNDYVGTVCGVNNGSLEKLTVDESSTVEGRNFVGGICGADVTGKQLQAGDAGTLFIGDRSYKELANGAKVTGTSYVGGITGYVYGMAPESTAENMVAISIEKCKNTGLISCKETEGICIGGIVGYNKFTKLVDCTNEVVLTGEEKEALLAAVEKHEVKGNFVGGIAGYNQYMPDQSAQTPEANLVRCVNGKKDGETYVIGRNFVGGIAGMNTQGLDSNGALRMGSLQADTQNAIVNDANVAGESYVGGIFGSYAKNKVENEAGSLANILQAGTYTDDTITFEETLDDTERVTAVLSGLQSKGTVTAGKAYAGGIVGFNTGRIEKCSADNDLTKAEMLLAEALRIGKDGSYVGGVVGYNNGILGNVTDQTDVTETDITAVVAGRNYVGGIVGYQDINAQTKGYSLKDGYVKGSHEEGSHFVGGFAGMNRSVHMPQAVVHFTSVEGDYFVGGYYGGNMPVADGTSDMVQSLHALWRSGSNGKTPGTVTARAFAGGYIGYHNPTAKTRAEIEEFCKQTALSAAGDITTASETVKNMSWTDSGVWLQIAPAGQEGKQGSSLQAVTAEIYAGGILGFGYSTEQAGVTVERMVNQTPVRTTSMEGGGTSGGISYLGGITGEVTQYMTVRQCRNEKANEMTKEQGDYLGSIAAVNRGTVEGCTTASMDYGSAKANGKPSGKVGGLVGKNEDTGTIKDSILSDVAISGETIVGGAVADNFGTIVNVTVTGTISGQSQVGGIAGANHSGTVSGCQAQNVTVTGTGSIIGGIVGLHNGGSVVDLNMPDGVTAVHTRTSGTVSGVSSVGGIIGEQYSGTVANAVNEASVTGQTYAGGITGAVTGKDLGETVISGCANLGELQAGDALNIAGILGGSNLAGTSSVQIKDCRNYGIAKQAKAAGSGTLSGILGSAEGNIPVLDNNFGVADCTYPVTNVNIGENAARNYYFMAGEEPDDDKDNGGRIHVTNVTGENLHVQNAAAPSVLFDGVLKGNDNAISYIVEPHPDSSKNFKLIITFETAKKLNSVGIYWGMPSAASKPTYRVNVLYEDDVQVEGEWQKGEGYDVTTAETAVKATVTNFNSKNKVKQIEIEMEPDTSYGIWEIYFNGHQAGWKGASVTDIAEEPDLLAVSEKGSGIPLYVKAENGAWVAKNEVNAKKLKEPLTMDPTDTANYGTLETRTALYTAIDPFLTVTDVKKE